MTSSEIELQEAWLAGLLEGEGYFGTITNWAANRKSYRYARIGINMTDRDIIERVAQMWETVVGEVLPSGQWRGPNPKRMYRAVIVGGKAVEWMRKLRPYMGDRRAAQIDAALAEIYAKPPTHERRRKSCSDFAKTRLRASDGTFTTIQ